MTNNGLIDISGIQILKNLTNVTLKDNNINKMDNFDGLPNLVFLDLNNNKLRNIEKANLGLLPLLRVLILDNNYLKNANPFKKFSSLNFLSLDNNKITEINKIEKLVDLEFLKEVSFLGNPFIKMFSYRIQIIKRIPSLIKLDGYEVSNEEKEYIQNEILGNQAQNTNFNPNQAANTIHDYNYKPIGNNDNGNIAPIIINNISSSTINNLNNRIMNNNMTTQDKNPKVIIQLQTITINI